MKVKMTPSLDQVNKSEGGINTIVRAYHKYMPKFGVEYTEDDSKADLFVVHAGMRQDTPLDKPLVAHIHGLYWTGDYPAQQWEFSENAAVVNSIRKADEVIVPSGWVAETIRRDMHLNPAVVGHGLDLTEWGVGQNGGYILWNKNRNTDVCDPSSVNELAQRFPKRLFLSTFAADNPTPNVKATGVVTHAVMKEMVRGANIYLATTKETFGIGTLEALASGVPVLGFNYGGTAELVQHKVNGYLAKPGDYDDLAEGLVYCLRNRSLLSEAALASAQLYSWEAITEDLYYIYCKVLNNFSTEAKVAVVIPCYNYGDKLGNAVTSVLFQTYPKVEVIIVNNNSTDNTEEVGLSLASHYSNVTYYNCLEQGVAHARNYGIYRTNANYICCLDADDTIESTFIETCVNALKKDRTIGVAYTKLLTVTQEGIETVSSWPDEYNFDKFLGGQNQVPTCSVFRRDLWSRLGGYRQRYAPLGQGSEDAEFYLRMGAIGYKGVLATKEALFHYHLGGRTQQQGYTEPYWRDKPWVQDRKHPFASVATPRMDSHPVRQYDQPLISVVIPCARQHEKYLVDALDSLESQTLRRWEAIVVFDGFGPAYGFQDAYPFVFSYWYSKQMGAGYARNAGVRYAKAPLLLFLDADDWLEPTALAEMLTGWQTHKNIIYSDYYGHAEIDEEEARKLDAKGRLVEYWTKLKRAKILHHAADYDRALALRQPDIDTRQFYIWNVISSLIPKQWHDEVGGFDEKMESWEDWDYWLRVARAGYGFTRLPVPLMNYRFSTGSRRQIGEEKFMQLTEYLLNKYRGQSIGGN